MSARPSLAHRHRVLAVVGLAVVGGAAAGASAQWSVQVLPSDFRSVTVYGGAGGQVVGSIPTLFQDAVVWQVGVPGYVSLHPDRSLVGPDRESYSEAFAADGTNQVGAIARTRCCGQPNDIRATMWSGTAASRVDLHPANAVHSWAYGLGDGEQVGLVYIDQRYSAVLWHGDAASWVILHPIGSLESIAYATARGQQVGEVRGFGMSPTGGSRASAWYGTPESWINLHPPAATSSGATATDGAHQGGYAVVNGVYRAAMWTGTADSWIDLHPAGLMGGRAGPEESQVQAVANGKQAGYANVRMAENWVPQHAMVWSGTPQSWVDLHSLPGILSNFDSSRATGIWKVRNVTYVAGQGFTCSPSPCRNVAILWTYRCLSDLVGTGDDGREPDGTVDGSDFVAFINSFAIGDASVDPVADVAGGGANALEPDGTIDGSDFIEFINSFVAGCWG